MPQRKRYLFVCVNKRADGEPKGSCAALGANEIYNTLKGTLKKQGLAKVEARTCSSSCLDTCWVGPTIAVEPDGYFYGHVTLADVPEIVAAIASGTRVERLVMAPEDFDEATARPKSAFQKPAIDVGRDSAFAGRSIDPASSGGAEGG